MKAYRTICFDCRSYCIPNAKKREQRILQCNMCLGLNLVQVGTGFRPPAKTRVQEWHKLQKVYNSQNESYRAQRNSKIRQLTDAISLRGQTPELARELDNVQKAENRMMFYGFGGSRSGRWKRDMGHGYKKPGVPKKLRENSFLESITF